MMMGVISFLPYGGAPVCFKMKKILQKKFLYTQSGARRKEKIREG